MKIMDPVTSCRNPAVIRAASLAEKKYREQSGLFLIEGEKLIREAISAGISLTELFVSDSIHERFMPAIDTITADPRQSDLCLYPVSDTCLARISTEKAPEGVIAVARHLDISEKYIKIDGSVFFAQNERMLILCDLRDPGNLGAVLRSALAFGITRVIFAGNCVDLYNPKTVRAAMGSLFRLTYGLADSFEELLTALHGANRRVLAAELTPRAIPVEHAHITQHDVFVIGNEGHGIPPAFSDACDGSVYIPISPFSESLNASVAASVLLWEQARGKQ